ESHLPSPRWNSHPEYDLFASPRHFALLLVAGYAANIPLHLVLFYAALGVSTCSVLRIWTARILQYIRARTSGARLVPIARGRWLGNLDILADLRRNWNVSYPLEVLREVLVSSHTNAVNLRIGWDDYIFTTEPEHIKIILATDFSNYIKGDFLRECMGSVLGEMWKFHRAATRPFFNRHRISDFDIFAHHADRAIERMKERLRAGYAIDFQDLASRFTMDSATSFLFGSCVDSLAAPLPYPASASASPCPTAPPARSDVFSAAYTAAIEHISSRSRIGWIWPLLELGGDATHTSMRIVDDYLTPIVRAAVDRGAAGNLKGAEPETLLDELLNLTSDPKVLKDEMLNILLAGRDTTTSVPHLRRLLVSPFLIPLNHRLNSILFRSLAVYPAVCKRLRAEILARVGCTRHPT
ncbi:cytochrome P450, partial [Mycena rosella]